MVKFDEKRGKQSVTAKKSKLRVNTVFFNDIRNDKYGKREDINNLSNNDRV